MRSVLRLLASGLILSFLFVASVYSQGSQTGGITGVVTDQTGALVKGATVDILSELTGSRCALLQPTTMAVSGPRCCRQEIIGYRSRPQILRRAWCQVSP